MAQLWWKLYFLASNISNMTKKGMLTGSHVQILSIETCLLMYLSIYIVTLDILQCANNGINYSKIQNGDICNVDKLEMFFSGYPKIIGMHLFPSLSCLVIMDQQVAKIEGLSTLALLRELWICDCQVKVKKFVLNLTFERMLILRLLKWC